MWKKNFNKKENEIIKKKNNNNNISQYSYEYHKYKCIFHHTILQNDCINSIDIIDDKIIIGTLMGDVYLCRVDENNLLVKNKDKNNNSINKYISKEINNNNNLNNLNNLNNYNNVNNFDNLEIPCIQLKVNDNNNINNSIVHDLEEKKLKNYINHKIKEKNEKIESQTNDKTNDKTKDKTRNKKIKMIKLNNKTNNSSKNYLNSNNSKFNNKVNIKKILIKNIKEEKNNDDINIRYDNTDIENNNKKSESSEDEKKNNNHSKEDLLNINIKKFPQVTKLIVKSNENIPCLEFDTDDKINVSIGDLEVLCLENMSQFNISDKNSTYDYLKIKNYKNECHHMKHCENCTCMMKSCQYLIVYTEFADFDSNFKFSYCKYKNRNLKTYKIESGKIQMSNYCVPFDFDGNRFLFLDYITKDERKICIYYTLSYENIYEYNIEKDFGHISHMKIISKEDNKIFLCRNNNICEIHLIDKDFTCIESWKHIGNDAISSFVYIKESKLTDEFKEKINIKKKMGVDINGYDYDYLINKNNNNKIVILKNKNKNKNKNKKNGNIEQIQGVSTVLNINSLISSSNNGKINIKCLNYEYNHTENIGKSSKIRKIKSSNPFKKLNNNDESSKREFNHSDKKLKIKMKINEVDIYNKKSINEELLIKDNQNKFNEIKENQFNKKNNQIIKIKDNKTNINTIGDENANNNNYYIITLDKNGNVNLYINKKVTKIFNLYEIENIDINYKNKEFFSIGFPYYIIMNELYIGITTDYGLFVISNCINE